VIEYLRAESRVLREQLGNRRVLFNDDQRCRLAVRAKRLGRKLLAEVATLVTPDTLLVWHRKLIAQKYAGHDKRRMVRKLDLHELRLVDRQRSELAIMAERHVESAGSIPLRPDSPGWRDESSPIPGHRLSA
jgi:hypothetical protein